MKSLKAFFVVFVILLLTASAVSAGYNQDHNWKHDKHSKHFTCKNGKCCDKNKCWKCTNCSKKDNGCKGGNCTQNNTTQNNTTVPPVAPINGSGTSIVKLCKNNVCTVGGDGKVIQLINNNAAVNPSYAQLIEFVKADKTDELPYKSNFVCSDFAKRFHDNAEKAGIKSGWCASENCNHAWNVFTTTDKGTIYIDCTGVPGGKANQDKELFLSKGKVTGQYLVSGYKLNYGCIAGDLLVYW